MEYFFYTRRRFREVYCRLTVPCTEKPRVKACYMGVFHQKYVILFLTCVVALESDSVRERHKNSQQYSWFYSVSRSSQGAKHRKRGLSRANRASLARPARETLASLPSITLRFVYSLQTFRLNTAIVPRRKTEE